MTKAEIEKMAREYVSREYVTLNGENAIITECNQNSMARNFIAGAEAVSAKAEKLVARVCVLIKAEVSEFDCACGYQEHVAEGYEAGTCFLHEALNALKDWNAK